MRKGVIIELRNQYTYILMKNGRVKRIKREYYHEVGQEIQFSLINLKVVVPIIVMTCCIMMIAVLNPFQKISHVQALSYLSLSVNPGLVLKVNNEDEIIAVSYTNQEGEQATNEINFVNKSLDESVLLFIDYCFENGYFQNNNQIDINVISDDKERIEKIERQVQTLIENYLKEHQVTVTIKMDEVTSNQQENAKILGIPDSKMKLIDLVLYYYPNYSKESLAKESVDDLIDYLEDIGYDEDMLDHMEDEIEKQEKENEKGHSHEKKISDEDAKKIAQKEVKGKIEDIEYENDENLYEVEIEKEDEEYKIKIDAHSGKVISIEKD